MNIARAQRWERQRGMLKVRGNGSSRCKCWSWKDKRGIPWRWEWYRHLCWVTHRPSEKTNEIRVKALWQLREKLESASAASHGAKPYRSNQSKIQEDSLEQLDFGSNHRCRRGILSDIESERHWCWRLDRWQRRSAPESCAKAMESGPTRSSDDRRPLEYTLVQERTKI